MELIIGVISFVTLAPSLSLHTKGKLLALATKIRLGLKLLSATNAQSYNTFVLITTVKSFFTAEAELELIFFERVPFRGETWIC
jgi:hypothetical protein